MRNLEDNTLLLFVFAVSLAFAWILWPFYEAVLWATVLAIVFAPLYRRLSITMGQRHSLAALATVLIIVTLVILPLTLIAASLVREATNLYEKIEFKPTGSRPVFSGVPRRSARMGNRSLERFRADEFHSDA